MYMYTYIPYRIIARDTQRSINEFVPGQVSDCNLLIAIDLEARINMEGYT